LGEDGRNFALRLIYLLNKAFRYVHERWRVSLYK
jgi:hypothetical protein